MAAETSESSGSETSTGLDENIAGALCYLLTWLTGIIFFVIEDNKFVKFHAVQSILFAIAIFVVYILLFIVQVFLAFIPRIGGILSLLFTLVWLVVPLLIFLLWLFLMYKAYQGEKYKLPVIGNMSENIAS